MKFWQLILLTIVFGGLALVNLRANNQRMGELKEAVVEADQEGEGVYEALNDLATYIFRHMNTSTEIELAATYDRHVQRATAGSQTDSVDAHIYEAAERECNKPNVPGTIRAQCFEDYVLEHAPPGSNPQPVELPLKQPYTYSFVAPVWSPDIAGFSLLLFAISGLWLLAKTSLWLVRHH